MNKLYLSIVATIAAFSGLSPPANAAGSGTGNVLAIQAGPASNNVFVQLSGTPSGQPACQTNNSWSFVFDSSTAVGKNTLAVILSAKALGITISYVGTNVCTLYGSVESLSYITQN